MATGQGETRGDSLAPEARRLAWIAGAFVVACSAVIALLGRSTDPFEPPGVSRGVASAFLLAAPGIVGLIGAAAGRRPVLVAAGVLCLLQSGISFSYVTLAFLLPAMIFLRVATTGEPSTPRPIRPLRVLIAVAIGAPVALAIILTTGILGVLILAVVAGIASTAGRQSRPRLTVTGAARGIAIVALVVAAWFASFAFAETACWLGRRGPDGGIAWERIPESRTLTLGPGDVVSTCAGGTLTMTGVVAAGGLVVAAFVLAAVPARRRPVAIGREPA